MSRTTITFGALSRPLLDQAAGEGFALKNHGQHQADADAITRLLVREIITEAEGHRARSRLTTAMSKDMEEL